MNSRYYEPRTQSLRMLTGCVCMFELGEHMGVGKSEMSHYCPEASHTLLITQTSLAKRHDGEMLFTHNAHTHTNTASPGRVGVDGVVS